MNRRGFMKSITLGALAAGVAKSDDAKASNDNMLMKSVIEDVQAGKDIDVRAVEEILDRMNSEEKWYYLRALYVENDDFRDLIESRTDWLTEIANMRGIQLDEDQ